MRVLHVSKTNGIGGSERHLLSLLPALSRAGTEVKMCVAGTGNYELFVQPLRALGIETSVLRAGPDFNPLLYGGLLKQVREFQPDIVHTHLIHADVHGQFAARTLRVPSVWSMHGAYDFYRRIPVRAVSSLAGHSAARTIAISHYVANFLEELRLARPSAIRVIHYGLDTSGWKPDDTRRAEARRRLGLGDGDVALGVASRLVADKGHAFLIDAFRAASHEVPDLRLLIAGAGPLRPELERQARGLPEGSVRFLGFLEDVRPFLDACDIFAFPTLPGFGEGFGLAALEAMAAGLPIIATRTGPLPELVADGVNGLLVSPGAVDELATAITSLAGDRSLRERLGAGGGERARTNFSLSRMVDQTMQVYDEVHPGQGGKAVRHA
jgi:glycosyltransferase involved in cell wall biosynthesis